MVSDDGLRRRAGRKLTKRKADRHLSPLNMPERFRDGTDAQEDVTASVGRNGRYMNQSVFSMIAAAGSKTDFHARFDDSSSDGDEDEDEDGDGDEARASNDGRPAIATVTDDTTAAGTDVPAKGLSYHPPMVRRRSAADKLMRSLPHLRVKTRVARDKSPSNSPTSSPRPLSEKGSPDTASAVLGPELAPVMSRMLEAQAQIEEGSAIDGVPLQLQQGETKETSLAARLREIFDFERPEHVIAGRLTHVKRRKTDKPQSIRAGCSRACYCRATCTSRPSTSASTPICPRKPYGRPRSTCSG